MTLAFQTILDEIEDNVKKTMRSLWECDVPFSVVPAKSGFGDVSCNVAFLLAKQLEKPPGEIAREISENYPRQNSPLVEKIRAHDSGYVNFFADWKRLSDLILSESVSDEFGSARLGNGSTIVVEHTSINPNKALHIGHVRNIVLGDTVSRILQKADYKVNVLNYVDDSGLQVADIIMGFKHLGFSEDPPKGKKFDHYCGDDVYVHAAARCEDDPRLADLRKQTLKNMEDGKSDIARFADRITRRVLSNQLDTCWNLGVTYDCINFESHIVRSGLWGRIFEKLKDMGLVKYEDAGKNSGCWVIGGKHDEEDKVLVRSNGTATYIAKDIPYAAWKLGLVDDPFGYVRHGSQPGGRMLWETTLEKHSERQNFSGSKVITVIDSRQARLQKIITDLMSRFDYNDAYVHLGYESVTLSRDTAKTLGLDTKGKQAQMSGRKGLYVSADAVYDLLKDKTTAETARRHPQMNGSDIEQIAHQIAVGALRYEMIKQDLDKMITFDLTQSLSLEGDTASYIQYTCARASRILEKSNHAISAKADYSLLSEAQERQLIKMIGMFGINVRDAAKNLSPKVVARYCHDLAVSFNEFYEKIRVIGTGDEHLENSRLFLVYSFKITLEKALGLLGICAPGKM